jgi:hypothetical protein
MKDMKKWLKAINYRITNTSTYMWKCFGNDTFRNKAFFIDCENINAYTASIITDRDTVYEVTLFSYKGDDTIAYRWINPKYKKAYKKEHEERGIDFNKAFDDIKWKDKSFKKILKLTRKVTGDK